MYQKRIPMASSRSFNSDASSDSEIVAGAEGDKGHGNYTQDVSSESESIKSTDSNDTIARDCEFIFQKKF